MSGLKAWTTKIGVLALIALASGCVSRGEYDRVEFARKTAVAHGDELEREVADSRAQRDMIEADRNALRRERDTKSAMVENLQAENRRLDEHLKKTAGFADEALKIGMREPDVITVTKLPPELDKALREFAQRYPETIEYLPEKGMVRWKSDLTFALGSDVIREGAGAALSEFANILNSTGASFEVVIVGHTDNVPIKASNKIHKDNWDLSCHRSIAVKTALHRSGVSQDRIGVMGYGEFRPREANPPAGGNEKNRRVEIFLVSNKDTFAAPGVASADNLAGTPRKSTTPAREGTRRAPTRTAGASKSAKAPAVEKAPVVNQAMPDVTPPPGG